jgi:hypothetical protein
MHRWWHIWRVLRVIDSGVRHESVAIYRRLRWSLRRLGNHSWTHPADIIPGARSRPNLWLRSVAALDWVAWMWKDTIWNWRRGRWGVMSDMLKLRRSLEM